MSQDGFATAPPPGENFKASEHQGALCIVIPHKFTTGVQTQFGMRNTIDASVLVLQGEGAGKEYIGTSLWNRKLVGQLTGLVGQYTLGRIALGQPAKAGQSPPVILNDPSPEDRETGQRWMQNNPGRIEQIQAIGKQMADAPKPAFQPQQPPYGQPQQWAQQPQQGQQYGQPGGYPPAPAPGGYGAPPPPGYNSPPPGYGPGPSQQQPYGQPPAQPAYAGPPPQQQQPEPYPWQGQQPGQAPPPPPVTNPDQPPF